MQNKIALTDRPTEVSLIGNVFGEFGTGFAGNVYDRNGISPTLQTMQGGWRQPMIIDDKDKGE